MQAKSNIQPHHPLSALDRLREELRQLDRSYPGVDVRLKVTPTNGFHTALVHVLLQFPAKVRLFGRNNLNERLQNLAIEVQQCSVMSVMPVDFRPDNLLALAVLSSFDDKSSPTRDQLWKTLCKGDAEPEPEVAGTSSLPPPPPARAPPSVSYKMEEIVRGRSSSRAASPAPRARSRTPAPRSRAATPAIPDARAQSYYAPAAGGRLLESIAGLWRLNTMQDFAPGTQVFKDLFDDVILFVPEWVFNILDYDMDPPFKVENNLASTIYGSSVIRCLKIMAKAMHVCGKLLYRASHEIVLILRDALDPLERLSQHLHKAIQASQGILPVLEAFRHMKADQSAVGKIGAKPETAGPGPIVSLRAVPSVIVCMPIENPIKAIYWQMFMASTRLLEMCPDDDVYICWDRIARKVWEMQQHLQEGHKRCLELMSYCAEKL